MNTLHMTRCLQSQHLSKGAVLNPKGWCFSGPQTSSIHSTPRKEDLTTRLTLKNRPQADLPEADIAATRIQASVRLRAQEMWRCLVIPLEDLRLVDLQITFFLKGTWSEPNLYDHVSCIYPLSYPVLSVNIVTLCWVFGISTVKWKMAKHIWELND